MRKLHCNARDKLACVTNVVATAGEEEASGKTLLVVVPTSYGLRNSRLARPGQPAQPENAPLICPVRPAVYLIEQSDARVWEACRLVLRRVRVKGRIFSAQETTESVLKLYC